MEDSGGERHEVECDDRPVSGDVEELKKLGNTAVCTVKRTILDPPVYNDTTYEIPGEQLCVCVCVRACVRACVCV